MKKMRVPHLGFAHVILLVNISLQCSPFWYIQVVMTMTNKWCCINWLDQNINKAIPCACKPLVRLHLKIIGWNTFETIKFCSKLIYQGDSISNRLDIFLTDQQSQDFHYVFGNQI